MQAQQQETARLLQQHISLAGKRIYNLIKQQHMTKADIRKRTSFPTKQIDDQLNNLSSLNLIKSIKNKDKKNMKLWILYHQRQEEEQEEKRNLNQDLITLITKKDSTLQSIKKQAIKNLYNLDKFQEILEMLKMRGEIFVYGDQVKIRHLNRIMVPCITCELKRLCAPGNTISPETCPYLTQW